MSDDDKKDEVPEVVPPVPEAKPPTTYDKYADFIKGNSGYKSIFQSDNIGMGKTPKK